MRQPFRRAAAALVLCAGPAAAADEDAKAVVEAAIKAHLGGRDGFAKVERYRQTTKGTQIDFADPEKRIPVVCEVTAEWPSRIRMTIELKSPTETKARTVVADGNVVKLAIKGPGGTESGELDADNANIVRSDTYALHWSSRLVPLRDGTAAKAAGVKVNGKATDGVKISRRGWPDVWYYFDCDTHLLAKVAYRDKEAGVEVQKDMEFGEYKEFDGLKMPTKMVERRDRKPVFELEVAELTFPKEFDKKLFEKP